MCLNIADGVTQAVIWEECSGCFSRARVRARGSGYETTALETDLLLLGHSAAPDQGHEAL